MSTTGPTAPPGTSREREMAEQPGVAQRLVEAFDDLRDAVAEQRPSPGRGVVTTRALGVDPDAPAALGKITRMS